MSAMTASSRALTKAGVPHSSTKPDVPPHAHAVQAPGMRRFRADGPHAGFDVRDRPRIGEQHVLNARADCANRQICPWVLFDLHHSGEVIEQVDRPPDVLQRVQVVRRVFGDELDVVEHPRMADQLHNRRPGDVQMRAQGRLPGVEQLSKTIAAHAGSLSSQRSKGNPKPHCGRLSHLSNDVARFVVTWAASGVQRLDPGRQTPNAARSAVHQTAELPHRLRKPFEIVLEPAHVGPVAETAGQKQEFFRLGRRHRQIAGVPPNDAQRVDQITLENVGLPQAGGVFRGDETMALSAAKASSVLTARSAGSR